MPKENKKADKTSEISTEELVFKALGQIDTDFLKRQEYEVHFVVPYDEDGGEVRGIIKNFTASSSADAVRYVSEKYGFPEIDDDAINKHEFPETERYGKIKARKVLNDKDFTAEDLLKSWEFMFNNYIRNVSINGIRTKSDDNREEVLMSLVRMFKLPQRNKLTDKYKI